MPRKKLFGFIFGLLLIGLPISLFALSNRQDIRQRAAEIVGVPAGYTQVWEDQFEGTSLDVSRWNYFIGQGATPDINYTPDSVSVADGKLTIKTYTENGKHNTGWITTENKYHPLFGFIEASIQFDNDDNILKGFWLFNSAVNQYGDPWNHGVELDIAEHVTTDYLNRDVRNQITSNLNWGQYGTDWDNHPGIGSGSRGAGIGTGYHKYAVEWTPTTQKYYIDGQFLWQVNDSTLSPVSRRDEYLVFSHHPVGGAIDYGSKLTSGNNMKVDYVKVYQFNPSAPPPPTNVTKSGSSGSTILKWDISANATKYNIKRSTSSGGSFTQIGTTTELTYLDTSADPVGTYYYVITASNSTSESTNSSQIHVQPNIARGKTATALTSRRPAASALDSNASTFWESDWASDPQWIMVDLQTPTNINGVSLNWEHAYAKAYKIEVSADGTSWSSVYSTNKGDGAVDEISFPSVTTRYVRMYGTERAHTYANPSPFGYAIKEFEVYSTAPAPSPTGLKGFTNKESVMLNWNHSPGATSYNIYRGTQNGGPYTKVGVSATNTNYTDSGLTNGTTYFHVVTSVNVTGESSYSNEVRTTPHDNIALWQQSYSSSKENADTRSYKAVDGAIDPIGGISTRWSSVASDPQWITVDLQIAYPINRVVLNWDQSARSYDIQTSLDGNSWTSVYTTTIGDGGIDDITFPQTNSRFIRMNGKQRATSQGYSLKELEIYSASSILTPPSTTPTPTILQPTPTPTITPTPTSVLIPTVTIPAGNTSLSLTLLLHGLGKGGDSANPNGGGNMSPVRPQRNVSIEILNSQNQLALSKIGNIIFNPETGTFTGNVDIGSTFVTGIYTIKVKSDQFLKSLVPGIQTITQGKANTSPQVTLITGDINNDNKIDIVDYNMLIECYSDDVQAKNCSDPAKKLMADLTDDGFVNYFDYNLFLREVTNVVGA